jgi:enoyl-CoA hydratase/carnithine racemase
MEVISSYFLPRLIGYSRAMHLITTGAVYLSTSPLFQDLFSEIVEPGDVLPRALELADDISRNTSSVSTLRPDEGHDLEGSGQRRRVSSARLQNQGDHWSCEARCSCL